MVPAMERNLDNAHLKDEDSAVSASMKVSDNLVAFQLGTTILNLIGIPSDSHYKSTVMKIKKSFNDLKDMTELKEIGFNIAFSLGVYLLGVLGILYGLMSEVNKVNVLFAFLFSLCPTLFFLMAFFNIKEDWDNDTKRIKKISEDDAVAFTFLKELGIDLVNSFHPNSEKVLAFESWIEAISQRELVVRDKSSYAEREYEKKALISNLGDFKSFRAKYTKHEWDCLSFPQKDSYKEDCREKLLVLTNIFIKYMQALMEDTLNNEHSVYKDVLGDIVLAHKNNEKVKSDSLKKEQKQEMIKQALRNNELLLELIAKSKNND